MSKHLGPEILSLISLQDYLQHSSFGFSLFWYAFHFWAAAFIIFLPIVFLSQLHTLAVPMINKGRIVAALLLLLVSMKSLLNLSPSEKLKSFPQLGYTFFNKGIFDLFTAAPPPATPEVKRIQQLVSELWEETSEGYIYPYPDYPLFKIGPYEYCLFKIGVADLCKKDQIRNRPIVAKNIVIISLESFRGLSFDGLSKVWQGLTPKLSRLMMEHSAWFGKAFSVVAPTDRALSTVLCSVPGNNNSPLASLVEPWSEVICLPDILSAIGYRSVRMSSGSAWYQNLGGFYLHHHTEDILGYAELKEKFNIEKLWNQKDIISDRDLTLSAQAWITFHRQLKPQQPFFMMLESMAAHAPWQATELAAYKHINIGPEVTGSEETLSFHRMVNYDDDIFSDFLNWLLKAEGGKLLRDSIVVVMADHPPYFPEPSQFKDYPHAVKATWIPLFFLGVDEALKGYHDLPAANFDITPTLLGLLQIRSANAFIGRDLFQSTRNDFLIWNEGNTFVFNNHMLLASPFQGANVVAMEERLSFTPLKNAQMEDILNLKSKYEQVYQHLYDYLWNKRSYVPPDFANNDGLKKIYGINPK